MAGKAVFVAAMLATCCACAVGQAPHPLSDADKQQIEGLIHRMTLEQKLDYINGAGSGIRAMPELGLPMLEMSDGPFGIRYDFPPSTAYAGGIGLASSWDRDLAKKVGEGLGRDSRARNVSFLLGPGVNIYRSPHNGRNFEYFGEDPFLAGQIASAYVVGVQSQGVSATVKHFLGNESEWLRHDSDTEIDERALREIYLPPFEAAVKLGHTGAIMDSYNLIRCKHATENAYFNNTIVRDEWHFPGVMMSDWEATYHSVGAANGGLDVEMPSGKFMNPKLLKPAVKRGQVSVATIDAKIRHILTTAFMFDWQKRDQLDAKISLDDSENNAIALQSAREAPVLLKNLDNLLPLHRAQIKTLLVVGPEAYPGQAAGGGSAAVAPFHTVSLLEGLKLVAQNATVLYDPGLPNLGDLADGTAFTTTPKGTAPGLLHETFAGQELKTPLTHATVKNLNLSGLSYETFPEEVLKSLPLRYSQQKQIFSDRFTGFYNVDAAGKHIIALSSSNERVLVDGKEVVNDWEINRAFEPHVTLDLAAGPHKVVVEMWHHGALPGKFRLAITSAKDIVNERAKKMAAKADAVVVAVGYGANANTVSEGEGGDRTFALPFGQDELIEALAAVNPRTIVTVTAGGNVDSSAWLTHVPAWLQTWYDGQAGGQAIAEILFGDVNPSGHLPATFERREQDNPSAANYYPDPGTKQVTYREGIFTGYRGYEHSHTEPLFPFGFGLSYTTFRFSNLHVRSHSGTTLATVSFDVTNTGTRAGADVAQVYVSDGHAPIPRPAHELKGFERVELAPGETKHVEVDLDARAFAYYAVAAKSWTIAPGKFTISVGDSLTSLLLTDDVEISIATASAAFN